ncbi:MAG: solute:sodium symporter family transporter [Pirellulales bacterium]
MFLTISSFIFFTALVGLITWFLTRKDDHGSSDGYFLAGRTLTGGYIAGSLMLTNLSTEQLVGLNGAAYANGLMVMAWEVVSGISLVVMALVFLPRFLKSGIATVPQFLEERFSESTRTILTFMFIIAYAVILLPIILYTGSKGLIGILNLSGMFGLENPDSPILYWSMVWMIGILGSLYAIFGGLRTVAVSDTINGFGLLVGGILIVIFGLYAVNDGGIFAALSEMKTAHPEKFNSIGSSDSGLPFWNLFTGVFLLTLFYWSTNQQIIQRTLGASSLKEGQKGVLFAGALKIIAPLIVVLPGLIAFHLYSHREGMIADNAYGTLVQEVLPGPLTGFFAAVMIGAILSSFNSALNSTATLFSLGIYKHILHPDANDDRVIWSGKVFAAFLAVASMTIAPLLLGRDGIFGYLQDMNSIYFIPILAVVIIGMFTKRVPAFAANLSLLIGLVALCLFFFVYIPSLPETDPITDLFKFHFLGIVFLSLIGLMLLIGKISPREIAFEQQDSGDVDLTPWVFAKPFGILLIVCVVALYVWFADFSVLWP